jgi:periplasmic divalent cation tolerance protein
VEFSHLVVLVTTASKSEAENIAKNLLEKKLIACANVIGPVCSYFTWENKIEQAEEFLLLLKSSQSLFDKLVEEVKLIHSYRIPEILALPVAAGSNDYLNWFTDSLTR